MRRKHRSKGEVVAMVESHKTLWIKSESKRFKFPPKTVDKVKTKEYSEAVFFHTTKMKKGSIAFWLIVSAAVGYLACHSLNPQTISLDDFNEISQDFKDTEGVDSENCQEETLLVRNEMEEKFQEALDQREIRCSQWSQCNQVAINCDCSIDFEEGKIAGKAEAAEEQRMYGDSTKKSEEYCNTHYCQEKILRRTRPIK